MTNRTNQPLRFATSIAKRALTGLFVTLQG